MHTLNRRCPENLIAPLIKIVIDEIRKACKKHPVACGFNTSDEAYEPLKLMQCVMAKTNEVCLRYLDNSMLCSLPSPGPPYNIVSVYALKNLRRKMEDRHVVIHDLNTMFNIQQASPSSYYAVFDGHAGHDAAAYSSAHLHQYLAESKHFINNPEQALIDAFCKTDALFIDKCRVEKLSSGTTAVCALLRPKEKTLYIAWAGDSQALLVNQGKVLQCVAPHKPSREDEKNRIEEQGGLVIYWGTWRVNGQLAVSRAIGDAEYKPYVTATPDVQEIPLSGGEDFLILACDGLWDFLSEDDAACAVYNMVANNPDDTESISHHLAKLAKQQGSTDNISVIVVFLREPSKVAADAHWANRNRLTMEAGLDNANATNNLFANSNGTEILQQKDGFMLRGNFKQNGAELSPSNEYPFNRPANGKRSAEEFDEDEDMGPETDVDAIDEGLLSPATEQGIIDNKNITGFDPFVAEIEEKVTLEMDLDIQKQQTSEFEPPRTPREETPTPPADEVHDAAGIEENVADSGEESEDEWNYYKGDSAESEKVSSSKADQEVAELTKTVEEDEDAAMSQLNPNAAEFVPISSPTRNVVSPACRALLNDEVIAQSPRRATPSDIDISLPNPLDFEKEVKNRPSDVYSNGQDENAQKLSTQEVMENLLNGRNIEDIEFHPGTPHKAAAGNTEEFHFGPNATPFSTPAKFLDQSEAALSTKAVYGDESSLLEGKTLGLEASFTTEEDITNLNPFKADEDVSDFQPQITKLPDPMAISFYQDENETNPFDLNKVQLLPDDDEIVDKQEKNGSQIKDATLDFLENSPISEDEAVVTDLDRPAEAEDVSLLCGVSKLPETPEPVLPCEEGSGDAALISDLPSAKSPILIEASQAPLPITPEPNSEEQEVISKSPDVVSPMPQENLIVDIHESSSPISPTPLSAPLMKTEDDLGFDNVSEEHKIISSALSPEPTDELSELTKSPEPLDDELIQQTLDTLARPDSKSPAILTPEPTEELLCQTKSPEPTDVSKLPEPTYLSKSPEPTDVSKLPEPTYLSKSPEPTDLSKSPEPTDLSKLSGSALMAEVIRLTEHIEFPTYQELVEHFDLPPEKSSTDLTGIDDSSLKAVSPDLIKDEPLEIPKSPILMSDEIEIQHKSPVPTLDEPIESHSISPLTQLEAELTPKSPVPLTENIQTIDSLLEDIAKSDVVEEKIKSPEPADELLVEPTSEPIIKATNTLEFISCNLQNLQFESFEPQQEVPLLEPESQPEVPLLEPEPQPEVPLLEPEPETEILPSDSKSQPEIHLLEAEPQKEVQPLEPEPHKELHPVEAEIQPLQPEPQPEVQPLEPEVQPDSKPIEPEPQSKVHQLLEPEIAVCEKQPEAFELSDLLSMPTKPESVKEDIEISKTFENIESLQSADIKEQLEPAEQLLTDEIQNILEASKSTELAECEAKSPETIEESLDSEKRDLDSPMEDITSSVKDDNSLTPEIIEEAKDISTEKEIIKDSFVSINEPPLVETEAIIEKENTCQVSSTPNTTLGEQTETESISTAEIHSILERSCIPDVTSPLSPSEQSLQQVLDAKLNEPVVLPTEEIIKTNLITPEYPQETVITPSEDMPTPTIEEKEAPAALPEVAPEAEVKGTNDEAVIAAGVGVAAAVATAAAVTAVTKEKKTTKTPAKVPSTTKKPSSTQSPTKLAATKPASAKTPTAAKTASSPTKPVPSKTTKTTTLKPAPTKLAASKPSPKPKTETTATKLADKKPLMNGDVKAPLKSPLTAKRLTSTSTAKSALTAKSPVAPKPSPIKSETKTSTTATKTSSTRLSSSSTATKPATATTTTTKPTTTTAPKPRPMSLTSRTTGSTASKTSSTVSANKTTVQSKLGVTASSPKTATPKPKPPASLLSKSPTTNTAPKPRVSATRTSLTKGPDTEKQIKDSVNKQLTATSRTTTTKTTGTLSAGRTSTTVKKTETKSPSTRTTTTTKTTVTTLKSTNKKPNEITRTTVKKTAPTKTVIKAQQNGLTNGVATTIVQETTTILSTESQLIKDLSPIENKLIVDNSQLTETNVTD